MRTIVYSDGWLFMEIRQLQTFREVARTLNFTRAATTLNYAQSSISAQIQALEEEFAVTLFDRLGRRIVLTDAGQRLLHYADKILALAEEAQIAVPGADEPVGLLTIGAPETLCTYRLPAVVNAFRRRFPRVDIIFRPSSNSEAWDVLLHDGLADAALIMAEPYRAPMLRVEPLLRESIRVVAHAEHPLACCPAVLFSAFRAETLLLTESGCPYRVAFERPLRAAGVTPANVLEFHSVEAIKQCALTGMGIAVLPEVVVTKELEEGSLRALPVQGLTFNLVTQLAWHKDKWLSPALDAFLSMTRAMLREEESCH